MTEIIKTDSRYLHGEDLQRDGVWREFTLTIKDVGEEHSATTKDDGKTKPRIIPGYPVYFEETPKVLVLKSGKGVRSINLSFAIAALGTNRRQDWIGQKLTVYPAMGNWFGQTDVVAVRIRVPEGQGRPFVSPAALGVDLTGRPVRNDGGESAIAT